MQFSALSLPSIHPAATSRCPPRRDCRSPTTAYWESSPWVRRGRPAFRGEWCTYRTPARRRRRRYRAAPKSSSKIRGCPLSSVRSRFIGKQGYACWGPPTVTASACFGSSPSLSWTLWRPVRLGCGRIFLWDALRVCPRCRSPFPTWSHAASTPAATCTSAIQAPWFVHAPWEGWAIWFLTLPRSVPLPLSVAPFCTPSLCACWWRRSAVARGTLRGCLCTDRRSVAERN